MFAYRGPENALRLIITKGHRGPHATLDMPFSEMSQGNFSMLFQIQFKRAPDAYHISNVTHVTVYLFGLGYIDACNPNVRPG